MVPHPAAIVEKRSTPAQEDSEVLSQGEMEEVFHESLKDMFSLFAWSSHLACEHQIKMEKKAMVEGASSYPPPTELGRTQTIAALFGQEPLAKGGHQRHFSDPGGFDIFLAIHSPPRSYDGDSHEEGSNNENDQSESSNSGKSGGSRRHKHHHGHHRHQKHHEHHKHHHHQRGHDKNHEKEFVLEEDLVVVGEEASEGSLFSSEAILGQTKSSSGSSFRHHKHKHRRKHKHHHKHHHRRNHENDHEEEEMPEEEPAGVDDESKDLSLTSSSGATTSTKSGSSSSHHHHHHHHRHGKKSKKHHKHGHSHRHRHRNQEVHSRFRSKSLPNIKIGVMEVMKRNQRKSMFTSQKEALEATVNSARPESLKMMDETRRKIFQR